jgi:hypothetical protein
MSIGEAIAQLRACGYTGDFEVGGRFLRCSSCKELHEPSDARVEAVIRVEGPSDPADASIIFGLSCARCGQRGVLVTAYGPAASPDEAEVLLGLLEARA